MKNNNRALRSTRLVVTHAMASAMLLVYGRSAYAGTCTETAPGTGVWICSGAAGADVTQPIFGSPVITFPSSGFGITTAVGDALTITGSGGTFFIDIQASQISGANRAIYARNNVSGDMIISTSGVITSGGDSIVVVNNGTGSANISSSGTVSSATGTGISGQNNAMAANLEITANDVCGAVNGISARNDGTGATLITTTGTVTGTTQSGIYASNYRGDLTIDAVDVTGGSNGILAVNSGTGETNITSTGTVIGTLDRGIHAQNDMAATGLTITTNNVTSGGIGIFASNSGRGALNITSTGTVVGTQYHGIHAHNVDTSARDLTITVVDVTGGMNGIYARNNGLNGITTITSTGTVSGETNFGIYARNDVNASDLMIRVVDVSSAQTGIYARNDDFRNAATTVIATGTVSGTGGNGINVSHSASGGDIYVSAVNVTGGVFGIVASNRSESTTEISVSGTITGGSDSGISTITNLHSLSTINLASTAVVGATSGNAITNNLGDSIINVANGATINGSVRLNNGFDTINISGVNAFAGITLLDGGDDVSLADGFVDDLNLNAWTGNLNGAIILNWEFININGGTVGFSNAAITAGQINVNNFGTFNGSNNLAVTGNVAVASGSNLIAGNAAGTNAMLITGNLTNFGNVRLTGPAGQQVAGDTLTVTGNYVGNGGTLFIDTVLGDDLSATDMLLIGGSASGSTGLFVNNVGGLGAMTTGDGIMVVDVAGASAANAFSLVNNLEVGAFNYYLYQNGIVNPADGDWYLRSAARGITGPAMALPDMGNEAGLSMLGSLQERLGVRGTEMDEGGAWIRIVGNSGSQTHVSNIGDFHARNDSHFVQAGVDFLTTDSGTRFGAFAASIQSNARLFDLDVNPAVEADRAHLDGYAVGGYATHYGDHYYWDAVIQHAWLDATASGDGDSFNTDNKNLLASFEFGRAFAFGDNHALEPQAQIIVGKGSTDSASDGVTTYDYDDEDIMLARLGLRWSHAKDQGTVKGSFVPYVKANVWRNFGDDARIQIGVSDITTEPKDTWVEVGFGFSVLTRNDWSMFLQYDYEKGLGDSDLENHSGLFGMRRSW